MVTYRSPFSSEPNPIEEDMLQKLLQQETERRSQPVSIPRPQFNMPSVPSAGTATGAPAVRNIPSVPGTVSDEAWLESASRLSQQDAANAARGGLSQIGSVAGRLGSEALRLIDLSKRAGIAGLETQARLIPDPVEPFVGRLGLGVAGGLLPPGVPTPIELIDENREDAGSLTDRIFGGYGDDERYKEYGFRDVIGEYGEGKRGAAIGFAGDVLFDPLTYVTAGAIKFTGGAGRVALASRLAQADVVTEIPTVASKLDDVVRWGEVALSKSERNTLVNMGILEKAGLRFGGTVLPGTAPIARATQRTLGATRIGLGGAASKIPTGRGSNLLNLFTPKSVKPFSEYFRGRGTGRQLFVELIADNIGRHGTAAGIQFSQDMGYRYYELIGGMSQLDPQVSAAVRNIVEGVDPQLFADDIAAQAAPYVVQVQDFYRDLLVSLNRQLSQYARSNGLINIRPINKLDDYFSHRLTEDARQLVIKNSGKRPAWYQQIESVLDGTSLQEFTYGVGPTRARKYTVGEEFMGVELKSGTIDEINAIFRNKANVDFDFFETDVASIMSSYITSMSKQYARIAAMDQLFKYGYDAVVPLLDNLIPDPVAAAALKDSLKGYQDALVAVIDTITGVVDDGTTALRGQRDAGVANKREAAKKLAAARKELDRAERRMVSAQDKYAKSSASQKVQFDAAQAPLLARIQDLKTAIDQGAAEQQAAQAYLISLHTQLFPNVKDRSSIPLEDIIGQIDAVLKSEAAKEARKKGKKVSAATTAEIAEKRKRLRVLRGQRTKLQNKYGRSIAMGPEPTPTPKPEPKVITGKQKPKGKAAKRGAAKKTVAKDSRGAVKFTVSFRGEDLDVVKPDSMPVEEWNAAVQSYKDKGANAVMAANTKNLFDSLTPSEKKVYYAVQRAERVALRNKIDRTIEPLTPRLVPDASGGMTSASTEPDVFKGSVPQPGTGVTTKGGSAPISAKDVSRYKKLRKKLLGEFFNERKIDKLTDDIEEALTRASYGYADLEDAADVVRRIDEEMLRLQDEIQSAEKIVHSMNGSDYFPSGFVYGAADHKGSFIGFFSSMEDLQRHAAHQIFLMEAPDSSRIFNVLDRSDWLSIKDYFFENVRWSMIDQGRFGEKFGEAYNSLMDHIQTQESFFAEIARASDAGEPYSDGVIDLVSAVRSIMEVDYVDENIWTEIQTSWMKALQQVSEETSTYLRETRVLDKDELLYEATGYFSEVPLRNREELSITVFPDVFNTNKNSTWVYNSSQPHELKPIIDNEEYIVAYNHPDFDAYSGNIEGEISNLERNELMRAQLVKRRQDYEKLQLESGQAMSAAKAAEIEYESAINDLQLAREDYLKKIDPKASRDVAASRKERVEEARAAMQTESVGTTGAVVQFSPDEGIEIARVLEGELTKMIPAQRQIEIARLRGAGVTRGTIQARPSTGQVNLAITDPDRSWVPGQRFEQAGGEEFTAIEKIWSVATADYATMPTTVERTIKRWARKIDDLILEAAEADPIFAERLATKFGKNGKVKSAVVNVKAKYPDRVPDSLYEAFPDAAVVDQNVTRRTTATAQAAGGEPAATVTPRFLAEPVPWKPSDPIVTRMGKVQDGYSAEVQEWLDINLEVIPANMRDRFLWLARLMSTGPSYDRGVTETLQTIARNETSANNEIYWMQAEQSAHKALTGESLPLPRKGEPNPFTSLPWNKPVEPVEPAPALAPAPAPATAGAGGKGKKPRKAAATAGAPEPPVPAVAEPAPVASAAPAWTEADQKALNALERKIKKLEAELEKPATAAPKKTEAREKLAEFRAQRDAAMQRKKLPVENVTLRGAESRLRKLERQAVRELDQFVKEQMGTEAYKKFASVRDAHIAALNEVDSLRLLDEDADKWMSEIKPALDQVLIDLGSSVPKNNRALSTVNDQFINNIRKVLLSSRKANLDPESIAILDNVLIALAANEARFAKSLGEYNKVITELNDVQAQNAAAQMARNAMEGMVFFDRLGVAIPMDLKEAMFPRVAEMVTPDGRNAFARFIQAFNGPFKRWAISTPGFAVRNAISAAFCNWVAGVSPSQQKLGMDFVQMLVQTAKSSGKSESRLEGIALGRAYSFDAAFEAGLKKGLFTEDDRNVLEVAYRGYLLSGGGRATDELMPIISTAANRALENRLQKARRIAGGDNAYVRWLRNQNEAIEMGARLPLGIMAAELGADANGARAMIAKWQFDYTDLSKVDETMKQIIPFWVWASRNIPTQIVGMLHNPVPYVTYDKLQDNLPEADDDTPWWLARRNAMKLGGDWVLNPDLPFIDMNEQLENIGSLRGLASQATPVLRVPYEVATGQNVYYGYDYRPNPTEAGLGDVPAGVIGSAVQGAGRLVKPEFTSPIRLAETEGGGTGVTELTQSVAGQLFPVVGLAQRLGQTAGLQPVLGGPSRYQDRRSVNPWMGYMGVPAYNISPAERQKQAERNARSLEELYQRMREEAGG